MEWDAFYSTEGPSTIWVITGRGRYGVGAVAIKRRRTADRCLNAFSCSSSAAICSNLGNQPNRSPSLSLVLINVTSAHNKTELIQDLILEEWTDLVCITETWVGAEGGATLSFMCPPWYAIQHQGRLGRWGEVAIVYKDIFVAARLSVWQVQL